MRTQLNCHPWTEWTAAKDGSNVKMTWDVTREGEDFKLTTHYKIEKNGEYTESETLHYLRPNRMSQCIGDRCLVKCRKCIREHGEGVACGHSLTCDCENYMRKNMCKHLHMLAKMAPPSTQSRAGCSNIGGVEEAGQATRMDHAYWVLSGLQFGVCFMLKFVHICMPITALKSCSFDQMLFCLCLAQSLY